jgi:hypothetical protein
MKVLRKALPLAHRLMVFRSLVLGTALLLALPACSTPQIRARQKPAVFAALAKNDQRLVLHGEVKELMIRDEVYIAWGRPDYISRGGDKRQALEVWTYEQQITQFAPMGSYEDRYVQRVGNFGGYRSPVPGGTWSDSAGPYSGRSFYRSSVLVIGHRYRKAVFVNGTLKSSVRWIRTF